MWFTSYVVQSVNRTMDILRRGPMIPTMDPWIDDKIILSLFHRPPDQRYIYNQST